MKLADHLTEKIRGTILLGAGPLEVDDMLLYDVEGDLQEDLSLVD